MKPNDLCQKKQRQFNGAKSDVLTNSAWTVG